MGQYSTGIIRHNGWGEGSTTPQLASNLEPWEVFIVCVHCIVYTVFCKLYCFHYFVYTVLFNCILCSVLCKLHYEYCIMFTVLGMPCMCAILLNRFKYSVLCTRFCVCCIICTVLCALCCVYYLVFTLQCSTYPV